MHLSIRRTLAALLMLAAGAQAATPGAAAPAATAPAATAPAATRPTAAAEWRPLALSEGRRLEVDPKSVRKEGDSIVVTTRTVFDKAMPDAISGASYRIIESTSRYDCGRRTAANLRRIYRKEQDDTLREEANKSPPDLPVRSGTFDDKVLKTACSPEGFGKLASEPAKANGDARRREILKADLAAADALRQQAGTPSQGGKRPPRPATATMAPAATGSASQWTYAGPGGPAEWASLATENRLCGNGRRQSPIDIRDSIAVDLEPIEFRYRPASFRVVDTGRTIRVELGNNEIRLLGATYRLQELHFHRPSEERIDGRGFEMVVHLTHRSDDGKLAKVAVLLEKGAENPAIQTIWNYLPLEPGQSTTPPGVELDLTQLLPNRRGYFTYMGSLTTPPCSEGVLWLVLQTPVEISREQAGIFARLYDHNARPIQPGHGRLIKGSR